MAGLEFIKRVSGTSITSLATGQVFSAKYDNYFVDVQWERVTTYPEVYLTDSSNTQLNNSSNDSHYRGAMLAMKSAATFTENKVDTPTYVGWRELGAYVDNVGEGYGMNFTLYNPFNSSKYTYAIAQSASMIGDNLTGGKSVAVFESAEQCNGLVFGNSSGTACDYIIANIYGVG